MKQKTHKGASKRIKITKKGKIIKGKVNNSHLFRKQDANKRMRKQRKNKLSTGFAKKFRILVNRGN